MHRLVDFVVTYLQLIICSFHELFFWGIFLLAILFLNISMCFSLRYVDKDLQAEVARFSQKLMNSYYMHSNRKLVELVRF